GEFEVDRGPAGAHQQVGIPILDVPTVLTKVNRDAVGAAEFGEYGRSHRIGLVGATRLSDGGHMVDVDEESHSVGSSNRAIPVATSDGRPRWRARVSVESASTEYSRRSGADNSARCR